MVIDSPFGHPGELFLLVLMVGLLAIGACLFIRSGGVIMRTMYKIDHPDDPNPPRWRYRRGLGDAVEDLRGYTRYIRLHGFDWAVRTNFVGIACFVAGVLIGQRMDAILQHFGWTCGPHTPFC